MPKVTIIDDYFGSNKNNRHTLPSIPDKEIRDNPLDVTKDYKEHALTPISDDVRRYLWDFLSPEIRLTVINILSKEFQLTTEVKIKAIKEIPQTSWNDLQEKIPAHISESVYKRWYIYHQQLKDILQISPLWLQDKTGHFRLGRQNRQAFEHIFKVLLGYEGFFGCKLAGLDMETYLEYCQHYRNALTIFKDIAHIKGNPLAFFQDNVRLIELTEAIQGVLEALEAIKQGLIADNVSVPRYLENYILAMTMLWHHLYALSPRFGVKYLNEDAQISTEIAINRSYN